jgi:hypothetical protein
MPHHIDFTHCGAPDVDLCKPTRRMIDFLEYTFSKKSN